MISFRSRPRGELVWRAARAAEAHLWTVGPIARSWISAVELPPQTPWSTVLTDPLVGPVELSGAWHDAGSSAALIVIHGLGGDVDSYYVRRAASAAHRRGISCLRLNLRGADLSGEDCYHAGLVDDVKAAVERLERFRHILILGYSMGGHLALWYALHPDPRVSAIASVCTPLDLSLACRDIDLPRRKLYRWWMLRSLKQAYGAMISRGRGSLPAKEIAKITSMYEWDDAVTAPRFGFRDAEQYYREMSVIGRLNRLRIPSLLVNTRHDPMVNGETTRLVLRASSQLEVRWLERGGHVGFPPDCRIGEPGPPGLEHQVLSWMLSRLPRSAREVSA